jgi:hypothetical protein
MKNKKIPQSIKKHIRNEKAKIRREIQDVKKQKEMINKLCQKFFKKDENKRNI